jgi:adenylate cyclase, class 2
MSYEVEVKFRSVDHETLADLLKQMGARADGAVDHEDLYFNHPVRDFAETNEALRIRRVGDANRITYKGPKHAGPTKTRKEIEIAVAEGAEVFHRLVELFKILGFRPVATVRKRRETFHLTYQEHAIEIALDVAQGLGAFAEIETIASGMADLPAAQQAVLALAAALGLTEVEPRSYLRMAIERP